MTANTISLSCIPAQLGAWDRMVKAARNELEAAQLRESITEEDWVLFDNERAQNKGATLAARNDRMALDLQVQYMRENGAL